jgi:hypothetical protein
MTAIIEPCLFGDQKDLPQDTPLYRYLSTESFLHLVEFRRLLFSRIADWPDSYEGSRYTLLSRLHGQTEFLGRNKDDFYATCWCLQTEDARLFTNPADHKNAIEEIQRDGSAAMWESYCKNGGVRIRTTLGKLDKLFQTKATDCVLYRGQVYYEPAESWTTTIKAPSLINTLLHKRVSFRHEMEYRYILVPDRAISGPVVAIEIDNIFELLDEILVCPATLRNKWVARILYHVGVDLTINKENDFCINSKREGNGQFCRISQLYASISETIGYDDMA